MAEEQSTLIELNIDLDKALADTVAYGKKVDDLKKSLDDLKNSQDANTEEVGKATAEYQAARDQYNANQKVLKQLTAAQEEEAGTLEKLAARNAQLRLERQKLNLETEEGKKRLKEINDELDQNNNIIKESSDSQKKQTLNIGNYTSALGGLEEKLGSIPGKTGGVVQGFGAMTKAAWAFVANPIGAVIAAIVLALTAFYKALTSTEQGTNKLNKVTAMLGSVFNGLMKVLSPLANFIADVVIKQFEMLGAVADKAMKLVSGGLKALGFDKAAEAVDNFGKSMADTSKAAMQLADEQAKLKEQMRLAEKIQLDYQKQAEKYRQLRDDESKSINERVKANESLNQTLKDQLSAEMAIANQALKVADLRIKAEGENTEALDERAEALTRISDIQERITGQESEYLANVNSLRKDQAALNKEASDARQKQLDEEKKANEEALREQAEAQVKALEYELAEFELKNKGKYDSAKFLTQQLVDEEVKRLTSINEKEKTILDQKHNSGLISESEYNMSLLQLESEKQTQLSAIQNEWKEIQLADALTAEQMRYDAEYALASENIFRQLELENEALRKQEQAEMELVNRLSVNEEEKKKLGLKIAEKYNKAEIALEKAKTNAKLALVGGFADNVAQIAGENTAVGKAAAAASTLISTYQAATGAYSSLASIPYVGPVLGVAAAAAAVAAGISNVKKIYAVKSGLPGDSGGSGGGSIAADTAAPSNIIQLPTVSSPTIGQGIISRETTDTTAISIKQGVSDALQENPLQPTLVVDDVTSKQTQQTNNNNTATI